MSHTLILEPSSNNGQNPLPLCLVFHGNNSNPQAEVDHWGALASMGWLVALPQSTRVGDQPGIFIWNNPGGEDWNFQEIQDHLAELKKKYPVDESRIMLAGFSMGGGMAIELIMRDHVLAQGFIVVAPYIPYKYVDPGSNYKDFVKARSARGYCVVGKEDSFGVEGSSALALRLPEVGISCLVETHPGLGHEYPSAFRQSLSKAVKFIGSK